MWTIVIAAAMAASILAGCSLSNAPAPTEPPTTATSAKPLYTPGPTEAPHASTATDPLVPDSTRVTITAPVAAATQMAAPPATPVSCAELGNCRQVGNLEEVVAYAIRTYPLPDYTKGCVSTLGSGTLAEEFDRALLCPSHEKLIESQVTDVGFWGFDGTLRNSIPDGRSFKLWQYQVDSGTLTISPNDDLGVLATSKSGTLLLRRDQGEMAVL